MTEKLKLIGIVALAAWNLWLTYELRDVRRNANEASYATNLAERAMNKAIAAYDLATDAYNRSR